MYRVEFQFAYGGRYYSETYTDIQDVNNLQADIAHSEGEVRFLGVEMSEDGESWEPYRNEAKA